MVDVKKSRDVNDILDNLKLTRTSSLGEVMGRASRGEGASGALASIYSKLRSSKESFAQRRERAGNLSPTRSAMGSPTRGTRTPLNSSARRPLKSKGSALLARLRKSGSKKVKSDKAANED